MVFDFYTRKIKVFVSEVSPGAETLKNHLIKVLVRAGMEVLCLQTENKSREELEEENQRFLSAADCTVHIIGNHDSHSDLQERNKSLSTFQLKQAQARINSEWRDFKIFIWHPANSLEQVISKEHDAFISSVRQGIMQNMIYSNRESIVSFVEDIRSVMFGGKPIEFDIENAQMFFIYNSIDGDSAQEIISIISDVVEIKPLEIILSNEVDYAELVSQQMMKSKLTVIFFKITAEWAMPFVQQIWKKVGGASSGTHILFIGDSGIDSNATVKFDAPNVTNIHAPHEVMPIEIKVHYDKVIGL